MYFTRCLRISLSGPSKRKQEALALGDFEQTVKIKQWPTDRNGQEKVGELQRNRN